MTTEIKIVISVVCVLLVLTLGILMKTYREKQRNVVIYTETTSLLKQDLNEKSAKEQNLKRSITNLNKENQDLQVKLERAVQYSQAEVELLNKRLKDFEELGRTKTQTTTLVGTGNISATSGANGRRRASTVLKGGGEESRLSKLRYHSSEVVFDPKDMLGRGSFGEVFKGIFHDAEVAIKTLKKVDEENLGRFKLEVLLMASIHHPNITFLLGMCWDEDLIGLMMEFADKGSLTTVLQSAAASETTNFSWKDPLLKYTIDVASGLHYLHNVKYFDYNVQPDRLRVWHV